MAKGKDKAKQEEVMVLIKDTTLKALLRADDSYKEKIDGLTGELREEIANAVDKKHLDKKAYALLKKFHRIDSPEEKHRIWHTLVRYMELSGEMKTIESVIPMELGDNVVELKGQQAAE